MMQIGIISDTHGFLSPAIIEHFKEVDQIFHAGDIGGIEIIKQLEQIAPVGAVCGNMDNWTIKRNFPPVLFSKQADHIICVVHDIGNKKKFCYELFKRKQKADIIIHGHTHRQEYILYNNKVFINPGSCAYPRGKKTGSLAIIELNEGELKYKFIDIG